jgi:hypothetical protein
MSVLNFGIKSSRQRNNEIIKDGNSTEGLTKEQKYIAFLRLSGQ